MNNEELNNDSLAILLICTNLAINFKVDSVKPFTTLEWSKLARILLNSTIKRPANLFNLSKEEMQRELLINPIESERITKLLSKAGQLSFELTELKSIGIKITTRAEKTYPSKLKERLKEKCPPVIYYCGDLSILESPLIGVVGSRNIDLEGLEFTKKLAKKIVEDKYSLVSGGAKGVDSISQEEVLSNNGKVVAFIADSMINKVKSRDTREAITTGNLLLMSAINPKSGFTVYSAMDRNKYIYGLSEMSLVVASDYNKGGTWTGANENLKNTWVPLLVRIDENVPKGNLELIKLGGNKFGIDSFSKEFNESILNEKVKTEEYYEENIFSLINNEVVNESEKPVNIDKSDIDNNTELNTISEVITIEPKQNTTYDVYDLIVNYIKEILTNELSLEEFCNKLNINKTQASIWLNRAIEEGLVKRLSKPVRYKSV